MGPRMTMGEENEHRSLLSKLGDWLWPHDRVREYDAEKAQNSNDVIARFARGNVLFQNGAVLDDEGLSDLVAKGDKAAERLRRHITAK